MPIIFDPNKPAPGDKFVSEDIRDNFNTLVRANDLRPSEQATPNLTVLVQSGRFTINAARSIEFSGGSSPAIDTTTGGAVGQQRVALLQIDDNADLAFKYGSWATAGAAAAPNADTNKIPIAEVLFDYNQTTLTDSDITDIRPFMSISAGGIGTIAPDKTIVTATDALGPNLGQIDFDTTFEYTPGQNELLVFIDGVHQLSGTDYTEFDIDTIQFSSAVPAGSVVCIWKVGLSVLPPGSTLFEELSDINANQSDAFKAGDAPTLANPYLTVSGHAAVDHSTITPIPTILSDLSTLDTTVTTHLAAAAAHSADNITVVDNLTFANPTTVQDAVDALETLRDDILDNFFLVEHIATGEHGPRITINQTDGASLFSVVDITNAGSGNDIEGNSSNWFIDKNGNATFGTVTANGSSPGIIVNQSTADNAVEIAKTNTSTGAGIYIENSGTGQGITIDQAGNGRGLQVAQGNANTSTALFTKAGGTGNCVEIFNTGTGSDIRGTSNTWSISKAGIASVAGISTAGGTAHRNLWGHVSSAGSIAGAGSTGWTVVQNGTGDYTITFSAAFAGNPIVQCTTIGGTEMVAQLASAPTTTTVQVLTFASGVATDTDFQFTAVGPV